METIGTFLGLIGVAVCFTLAMMAGVWCGYHIVNFFTGGELDRIFGGY